MSGTDAPQETAQETWDHDRIMAAVEKMFAMGETAPREARDPINQPMINNWLEAMGETDPRYSDGIAPPAMAQVWTMYGLDPTRPADDPLHGTMQIFDAAGFKSVLGTNCDQTYLRDVKVGEQISITTRLESVVGPKVTGVGEGYFVSTLNTWWVAKKNEQGGEEREAVATMLFRVLKFKPAQRKPRVDKTKLVRPQMNRDTAYFWEGTKAGELRLQKCNACGELRHPPGPMCPTCHTADRGYVVASGRGTVFSFLVHHAPQLPGKELPITLALIELEEGLRMVGEVQGNRENIAIGAPVRVVFEQIDDDLTLAQWEVTA
ncbi:bifunctional MaoC family dehydratase N-terminal/OB-fold nucleic acid binding domain-containing protein [Marmoricola sp. RAF53]|uniref:bifunctional MaoC family dehydratase N-terminal/OB-fold nucleic acid binding domain-containing protein n=1 Tax=Marmoricola sp. RAF53 TaxID=3233059 RepID=UPI003F9D741F